MFDTSIVIVILGTFFLAGFVKGIIGLGLPTISLALLTIAINLPTSMALILVPSLVTNIWQAIGGQNGRAIILRLWPFFLLATLSVWPGAILFTTIDLSFLSALLGFLLIVYTSFHFSGLRFVVKSQNERWIGTLAGITNGVITGMTGSFILPGVLYIHAIGLSRDTLIQAMGILFTLSTIALAIALKNIDLLNTEYAFWSTIAVAPALAGMMIGRHFRKRLSESVFRQAFYSSLFIIGVFIVLKALIN